MKTFSAVALLLVTAACSSNPLSQARGFCTTYCGRLTTCDSSVDKDTCENACENSSSATLPKLRPEIVSKAQKCLEAKDCKLVTDGKALGTCFDETAVATPPSAEAGKLCDSIETIATKCKLTDFKKAKCLETARVYSDETLTDAQKCAGKACTDVSACLEAAYGTSDRVMPVGRTACEKALDAMKTCPNKVPVPASAPVGTCTGAVEAAYQCVVDHTEGYCAYVESRGTATGVPAAAEGYVTCITEAQQTRAPQGG